MSEHERDEELWDEPPGREELDDERGDDRGVPAAPIEEERTEQLERRETPLH